jgi:hypothetical protein
MWANDTQEYTNIAKQTFGQNIRDKKCGAIGNVFGNTCNWWNPFGA